MNYTTLPVESLAFGREYNWIPSECGRRKAQKQCAIVMVRAIHLSGKQGSTAVLQNVRGNREMFVYNPAYGRGCLVMKHQVVRVRR